VAALKVLLALAIKINADMTWLASFDSPMAVLIEGAWLETDA